MAPVGAEEVGQLKITMDDPARMQVAESKQHLPRRGAGLGREVEREHGREAIRETGGGSERCGPEAVPDEGIAQPRPRSIS